MTLPMGIYCNVRAVIMGEGVSGRGAGFGWLEEAKEGQGLLSGMKNDCEAPPCHEIYDTSAGWHASLDRRAEDLANLKH